MHEYIEHLPIRQLAKESHAVFGISALLKTFLCTAFWRGERQRDYKINLKRKKEKTTLRFGILIIK